MTRLRRIGGIAAAVLLLTSGVATAWTMPEGMYSPYGAAARERDAGGLTMRYIYLTGQVDGGRQFASTSPGGEGLASYLEESAQERMPTVLTLYDIQPSGPARMTQVGRARLVLRSRRLMRAYWEDVADILRIAAAHPDVRIILHVEPDQWEFMEQLRGIRTPVAVSDTGLRELRGLPDDVRGFAQAFVRLRNRLAPHVLLGWHLSGWGVGQTATASIGDSLRLGDVGADFYRALHADFDVALTDAPGVRYTDANFAQSMAMIGEFHRRTGLPVLLWQLPAAGASFLLGTDHGARTRLIRARRDGVRGILWSQAPAHSARFMRITRSYAHRPPARRIR